MPPSFSGGLLCASAVVALAASSAARTPERARFILNLPVDMPHYFAAFISVAAIMPQAVGSGKEQRTRQSRGRFAISVFSAKRNGQRHARIRIPAQARSPFPGTWL